MNFTMHPPAMVALKPPPVGPDFQHDATWRISGTPQDRLARVAARRAFVEMKQCFMAAAGDLIGGDADLTRHRLRQAADVFDLWRLHEPLMAALPATASGDAQRRDVREQIDTAFPRNHHPFSFSSF
jgi:hypothetical protein